MGLVLDQSGFHSTVAHSSDQALHLARSAQFDILLSDVIMEPIDNSQLAIAFQAIHPAARIFLISGNERAAALLLDAIRSGYDFPIFAKPISPEELLAVLRVASEGEAGGNARHS
ncbi:MAG TPA: response regulator [Terracidiphilus sp.]|nr:response regulator [Terracidiphilus sp.]